MKILIDMNLSPEWVLFLRSRGFEAIHWDSIGKAAAPDHEIFDYAIREKLVILTLDLDFSAILANTGL